MEENHSVDHPLVDGQRLHCRSPSPPLLIDNPPSGRILFLPVNEVDLSGQNTVDYLKAGGDATLDHICKNAKFFIAPDQLAVDFKRAGLQDLLKAYVSNSNPSADADLFRRMSQAAASQGYDLLLRITIKADGWQHSGGDAAGLGMSTKGTISVTFSEYRAGEVTPRRTANGSGPVDYGWGLLLYIPIALGKGTSNGVDHATHEALTRLYANERPALEWRKGIYGEE